MLFKVKRDFPQPLQYYCLYIHILGCFFLLYLMALSLIA